MGRFLLGRALPHAGRYPARLPAQPRLLAAASQRGIRRHVRRRRHRNRPIHLPGEDCKKVRKA